jgi:hypothetical protein
MSFGKVLERVKYMNVKIDPVGSRLTSEQRAILSRSISGFSYSQVETHPTSDLEEKLLELLFGTKRWRFRGMPELEIREDFLRRLRSWTEHKVPMPVVIFWGALKGDNNVRQIFGPDLSEFFALSKLKALHARVEAVYPPGIRFTIITEDIAERVLHKDLDTLAQKIAVYVSGLTSLCDVLGMNAFTALRGESDILREKEVADGAFLGDAKKNAAALQEYWMASDNIAEEDRELLPEYRTLVSTGWRGTIPDVLRRYYLDRVENQHTALSQSEKVRKVTEYLGICLGRFQYDFFRTEKQGTSALRIAFNPYPSSLDAGLRKGRIELKLNESQSNRSHNPWNSFTALQFIGDRPAFKVMTTHEFNARYEGKAESVLLEANGVTTTLPLVLIES